MSYVAKSRKLCYIKFKLWKSELSCFFVGVGNLHWVSRDETDLGGEDGEEMGKIET